MPTSQHPATEPRPPASPGSLSLGDAKARVAEFLQDFPLYTPLKLVLAEPAKAEDLAPRAIARYCPQCKAETTWLMGGYFPNGGPEAGCAKCQSRSVEFRINFEPYPYRHHQAAARSIPVSSTSWVLRKYGQWPGWSISPPREIEATLDAVDLDLYKKALVCMSQGYGLGAVAYFRRVIENEVVALLDLVEDAAKADGDEEALDAVRGARESHVAEEKLRLVAEHVPRGLRPSGVNPLAVLYGGFSRGIHALSDEECLAVALELRTAFDFVFKNLRQVVREAKEYASQIALAAKKGTR